MPKYVSVRQYRDLDFGVLPPTMNDRQLANWIQQAESDIDAWIGFPLQLGGFEPHTGFVQVPWNDVTRKARIPNWPVPLRNVIRYRIQVSNISQSGAGFFQNINPGDVAFDEFSGYIEIVPLQAVTYSLSPVILQLGLKPPIIQLDYEAGFYLPTYGEVLMNEGNNQTYYGSRGFWAMTYTQASFLQPNTLPPIPPVVSVNGSVVSSSTYTVNAVEGSIQFTSVQPSSATVTADYTYTIPDTVKKATTSRTTWHLSQLMLNKIGFVPGLQNVRSGDQEMRRPLRPVLVEDLLDPATSSSIMNYKSIAVG